MRIRRPPPGQQPIAYLLPYPRPQSSPPPAASRPPPPPPGDKKQGDGLHLHPAPNHSAADLGDAARSSASSPLRRPALPQDGAVEQRSSALLGAHQEQQQQQQQQGPADGRTGRKRAPPNPSKQEEGSRCSRKNGRGWRCSQPTPKGYALCEYHLGKGRMKSGSAETGRRGPGQLGRTEHAANKTFAAAAASATSAAPKAGMPPLPATLGAQGGRVDATERAALLGAHGMPHGGG